jgi:hypothetical protein
MDRDEALATIDAALLSGEHIDDSVYKIAYAPETAAQPDTSTPGTAATPTTAAAGVPTTEQAQEKIAKIRTELDTVNQGSPRHKELMQQMEDQYKTLYPPSPADVAQPADDDGHAAPDPVASVPPLEVPPVPMELAGEHAYDRDALAELGPAMAGAGLAKDDVQMWIRVGNDSLTEREHRTTEQCFEELDRRFGAEKADEMVSDAVSVLSRLTPTTRAAVERWLDATGLANHPSFIEWLSGQATKLRGAKS